MTEWIEDWARNRIAERPNLTVRQMAQELRIPLSDLYRVGLGQDAPKKFLVRLRLELVKRELARNERTMRGIARQFAFCDECYFSKWFKRLAGVSPKRFQVEARLSREFRFENQERSSR